MLWTPPATRLSAVCDAQFPSNGFQQLVVFLPLLAAPVLNPTWQQRSGFRFRCFTALQPKYNCLAMTVISVNTFVDLHACAPLSRKVVSQRDLGQLA